MGNVAKASSKLFFVDKNTYQFHDDSIKNYNQESDEEYFLEVDIQYLEKLHKLQIDWPFLPEKMKIGKIKKLLAKLRDKSEYVIHKRNLKQALNHRLTLKKVHKVIKFNQNTWLKPYNDMKTDLRKKSKKWFRKNSLFGKTI